MTAHPGRYRDDRERGELLRIGVTGLVGMVAAFLAGATTAGPVHAAATAVLVVCGGLVVVELARWVTRSAKARDR